MEYEPGVWLLCGESILIGLIEMPPDWQWLTQQSLASSDPIQSHEAVWFDQDSFL